jgi:hypothetical protein
MRHSVELLRDARPDLAGKSSHEILTKHAKEVEELAANIRLSETGGQVRRDIERVAPSTAGETVLNIGGVETKVAASPKTTKVVGVVPRDVKPGRMVKDVRALGYSFDLMQPDVSAGELNSIAKDIEAIAKGTP